jgi:hypothetical protein
MNVSLLTKWWWKLDNETGLWQRIVKYKYLRKVSIMDVSHKQTDSPIWADLLKIKNVYLQGRKMVVHNGKSTLFYKDSWLNEKPLCVLFPEMFKFCEQTNLLVDQARSNPQTISFTRWLEDDTLEAWLTILNDMRQVQFTSANDVVRWKLGSGDRFSVKSVYNALIVNDSGPYHKKNWKGKLPAKIKIFLWLILNNAILTKDNMLRRKWVGSPTCYFCNQEESVSHLFFQCSTVKAVWAIIAQCIGADDIPKSFDQSWRWCNKWLPLGEQFHTFGIAAVCWAIWKTRNKACFEGKLIRNPAEIVCYTCALMGYWAGLFQGIDKETLEAGVNTMLKIAARLLEKEKPNDGNPLLKDKPEDDMQE